MTEYKIEVEYWQDREHQAVPKRRTSYSFTQDFDDLGAAKNQAYEELKMVPDPIQAIISDGEKELSVIQPTGSRYYLLLGKDEDYEGFESRVLLGDGADDMVPPFAKKIEVEIKVTTTLHPLKEIEKIVVPDEDGDLQIMQNGRMTAGRMDKIIAWTPVEETPEWKEWQKTGTNHELTKAHYPVNKFALADQPHSYIATRWQKRLVWLIEIRNIQHLDDITTEWDDVELTAFWCGNDDVSEIRFINGCRIPALTTSW